MKRRLGERPDLDQIKRFVRGEANRAENRESPVRASGP